MKEEELKYKYPVGDFLSGFSEDPNNPCGYELECQRMVSRGVQYLDDHKELCDVVDIGGVKTSDQRIKPMIHFMCLNESGHSGAMIDKTVRVSFVAKKMGWKTYIQKITEFQQQEQ